MSRIPPAVIAEVEERAGGYCEACGLPALRVEFHHRQARKMGGGTGRALDVAVNLLRLHPECHGLAHGRKKAAAIAHGFIVSEWARPEDIDVIPAPGWRR